MENPDGTTTEVTMVCVQDQDGNVVRGADGKVDRSRCNFDRPATAGGGPFGWLSGLTGGGAPPAGWGGSSLALVVAVVIFLVATFLFF